MGSPLHRLDPAQEPLFVGRIVHCAHYGGPYPGSFIPMLIGATVAARDRGYETTICFSELARERQWLHELSGLAEIRFVTPSGGRVTRRQLKHVLDESNGLPTVIHTHFGAFDRTSALLRLQRKRTVVLWHMHSAFNRSVRPRSKAYGAVFGRIVDAILCVSPAIYEEVLARRFPRGKLRQLPNAIDLVRFGPISAKERAAARRELGISPSALVALHFGWDWHRKGGDLLLAAAELMVSDPGVVFITLVSEGADRGQVQGHPNVEAVHPYANVAALYAAADVFLSCSTAEGMPFALLEALARGLPVVATDLPIARTLLAQLPGARVVEPDPRAVSL